MSKILIVDDHAVVRGGLKQFLAETHDLEIAGEASSAKEALLLLDRHPWDLVLLDIALPDVNGLEILKRIKREKPALPVLVFSMFSEDEYAINALNAGASGYLAKDSPPAQILDAIRRVVRGERYISPALGEKLLAGTAPRPRVLPHERLSPREHEVMVLLGRGVPLTQIGTRLNVSVKTVSTYRTRVLEKLGIESNAEITRYIIEHKLDA